MSRRLAVLFFLLAPIVPLRAQSHFFQTWQTRATEIQAKQPTWSPPLVAPYPMLVQVFRSDFGRQITPGLTSTWNYGVNRGLNLIPGWNSEVDFYYPPYIQHNAPTAKDGFSDVGFLYKYRILSGNAQHGSYMLSAQITANLPTGSYSNGSTDAGVVPSLLAGKGFGRFDIISSVGGALPVANTNKLGRTIVWNNTAQYHIGKYIWPEVEANTTHFFGGRNDGRTQNFLTPGLTTSKFKFHPRDARSRTGFAMGAGMQIATSEFHTYNHGLVFSGRLLF